MRMGKIELARRSRELSFVRDTFEKVVRLEEVLGFFGNDAFLSSRLALKGGTAINLTMLALPRLSVDIDLDYCANADKDEMFAEREKIRGLIDKYMSAEGYQRSQKSRSGYALDSLIYRYVSSGGAGDNLKIDINYMLRQHVLPLENKKIATLSESGEISVLCLGKLEIFAAKIMALIDRGAPRDLYDVVGLKRAINFNENDMDLLRRLVVFYDAITSSGQYPLSFSKIDGLTFDDIKANLLPVIHANEHFPLDEYKKEAISFLDELLVLTPTEKRFLDEFSAGRYHPELLFPEEEFVSRIISHPMAMFKCGHK